MVKVIVRVVLKILTLGFYTYIQKRKEEEENEQK
uniref:Uncharacterized protein n=1 Tax=Dulem virus 165 TaxID=3145642 RepID=A0AAU8B441_9VIRU